MKVNDEVMKIYAVATSMAMMKNQTVGEKNDYYITLAQLESIIEDVNVLHQP